MIIANNLQKLSPWVSVSPCEPISPSAVLILWLVPVFDGNARMAILTTFAPVHCFTSNVVRRRRRCVGTGASECRTA